MKIRPLTGRRAAVALASLLFLMLVQSALAVPGTTTGHVTDLSHPTSPLNVALEVQYEWENLPAAGGNINVAMWVHDSGNPAGAPVANVGGAFMTASGSVGTGVVANVANDATLLCTRMVMTVDGEGVAQHFIDHAGTYCADHFGYQATVSDQSQVTSPLNTALAVDYSWSAINSVGAAINVEMWIYDTGSPDGAHIANVGGAPPSGSTSTGVVANVATDPILSCTRMVFTVDGIPVAQDYTDHAGTRCAGLFGAIVAAPPPVLQPTVIPSLDAWSRMAIVLLLAFAGWLVLTLRSR